MGEILALDFGTTNSVVARWDAARQQAEVVRLPGLGAPAADGRLGLVPSLLYVLDGQTGAAAAGQSVLDAGLVGRRDNRLFRSLKRGVTARPPEGAALALEARLIDGAPWSEHDAGRSFLQHILQALPYQNEQIDQLVLTVPVGAFDGYLSWLSQALSQALLAFPAERIRIVDESTAAALGHAITRPEALVFVLDFGGGSLDLSLVRLPESREKTGGLLARLAGRSQGGSHLARVIAKAGLSLGGSDIDQWLLAEALQRLELDVQALGSGYAALLAACEQTKISLSNQEQAGLVFVDGGGLPCDLVFTRTELESLLAAHGFYDAVRQVVRRVLDQAHRQGIFQEDVLDVLLVGGTALIPSVQAVVQQLFPSAALRLDRPFTAIAEGALQLALTGGLDDRLAHAYGLRCLDPQVKRIRYDEIIPAGTRYPMEKAVEVRLAASHRGQRQVEFGLGQIESDDFGAVQVVYEDGQAAFIAQAGQANASILPLHNGGAPLRVRLDPPGQPGLERLLARLWVDSQRRLHLAVQDLKTGKTLLADEIAARLGEAAEPAGELPLALPDEPGGREPCLADHARQGTRRLSPRGLATMLNLLPPESFSLDALAQALRSPEAMVRYSAAEKLSRRGDREARLILEEVLSEAQPHERASAVRHLGRFSWFTAEPLLRQALRDPDQRVRQGAIFALCRSSASQAFDLLEEALRGGEDDLRAEAAWSLSAGADERAVPALEQALQAGQAEIRAAALEALGASGSSRALPAVRRGLDDPLPEVVYAAALSLVELAGEACFPELAERIQAARGSARLALLCGCFHATNYRLIAIGGSPHGSVLLAAAAACSRDPLPAARLQAGMLLAWARHPEADAGLLALFQAESDPETLARLLQAAVHLMSPVAPDLLALALDSTHVEVQQAARLLQVERGQPA